MTASPQWGRTTKQLAAATLLILAGLLLYGFRPILPTVIIACLFAYVFAPVVGWLSEHLRIKRGIAAVLIYLIALAALATAPAIIVPSILDEVQAFVTNLDVIVNWVITRIDAIEAFEAFGYVIPAPDIAIPTVSFELDKLMALFEGTISPIAGGAFSIVWMVASGVGQIGLIVIISFYLLVDTDRVSSAWRGLVPAPYMDEISSLIKQINATWNSFLRGQLVLCLVVGVMVTVATSALGLRYSIALGIIAGLLEIVPSLGPFLSAIPAVLLALFQGSAYIPLSHLWVAVIVALTYWVIQSIENNLLVPRILGARLNLHPVVVIIGVLGGVTLAGILGAFLASPVLATLRHILHYIFCKLSDIEPFPPSPSFAAIVQERDIRGILFDLDGTLLDTDDMAVDQISGWLRRFAFLDRLYTRRQSVDRQLARRLLVALETPLNFALTVLDTFGLGKKVLSWGAWLRAIYGQQQPARYIAIDGVGRLIQESSEHYDLAIATTRGRRDTLAFVERFGLQDHFGAIVTRQDVRRLKPHPESIVRAAEQLGYSPEQCIVVGDTIVDIQAGKRAGALTVAVLCGFGERAELERVGPDLVIESTAHLLAHLPNSDRETLAEW
jgi:predicted PurR-regulated permease PerM/phosphoglycolate phosphatase-like HAD superfamily hydrolase